MIVLDTTVLVYAKGVDHPLREPCRTLVDAVARRDIAATTTVEVIQEFAHVRARRHGRADAAQLASDYADLLAPLVQVTPAHLADGLALFSRHPGVGAFDAVLAAAALAIGADALLSADAGFSQLPRLPHIVPTKDGIAELLAR
ncbi:MAG: type II toxin-antitoxin system VapC family toxin [Micromonosporaceae bacterium]